MSVVMLPFIFAPIAVVLAFLFLTWNYTYWRKRGVAGPRPTLFYGNFPRAGRGETHMIYEVQELYKSYKKHESFIGIFWARTPQILLLDPKLIRDVLITNFKSFHDNQSSLWPRKTVEQMSVANPFMIPGDIWKEKRAEVMSGLTTAKLKFAYPIMKEVCKKLTNYIHSRIEAGTSELEARDFSQKFTGEIVADFLWGMEAGAFKNSSEDCVFIAKAKKMIRQSFKCVSFYESTQICPIVRKFKTVRFYPESTDNFFLNLQKDAMEMRLKNNSKRADMLQHLMDVQDKKQISTVDVTGHSLTVVLDGYESSGLVMSQTLLFLSRNVNAQQKLREEIVGNLDENGFLSFENLNNLPYLDQCVNETLRIIPPVPIITKICTERFEFTKTDGEKVEVLPGMLSHIPIYSLHHDEDVYPDPDEYIPERFDEENGGIKRFKELGYFLPFGDGPRICLGLKLALTEIKTGVVEVVKNFEFTSTEKTRSDNQTDDDTTFLLAFKGGIHLQMNPISK